jgi:hypothetical protein
VTPTVYFLVNGIWNWPGSCRGWTDDGATWIHSETNARAEKIENATTIVFRQFVQGHHIKELARKINQYDPSWKINLIGHSNGAAIICGALPLIQPVVNVHLLSPACDADFYENNLHEALTRGRVKRVTVYIAEKDVPMKFARVSKFLLGWCNLGFGTLGLSGPINAPANCVEVVREKTFGHSDWWKPANFDATMRRICGDDCIPFNANSGH